MKRARRIADCGVSLTELVTTIAIAALLAAMALPGFAPLLDRFRVSMAAGNFRAALVHARTEAIRRGRRIDLLPSVKGDWQSGWQVVIDENNNQTADAGESVLRTSPAVPNGVVISASLRDRRRAYLAFDPSGRARSAQSAMVPQFGSLLFRAGGERRKLVISFLGRARLCDPDREPGAC